MAFVYQGQEQIGNLNVYSFRDEEGKPFKTEEPELALQLGAPVGQDPAGYMPEAPAVEPAPDARLAQNVSLNMVPPDTGETAPQQQADVPAFLDAGLKQAGAVQPMAPKEQQAYDAERAAMGRLGELPAPAPTQQRSQFQGGAAPAEQQEEGYTPVVPMAPLDMNRRVIRSSGRPAQFIDKSRKFKGDPDAVEGLMTAGNQLYDSQVNTEIQRSELAQAEMEKQKQAALHEAMQLSVQKSEAEDELARKEAYKRERLGAIQKEEQEIASRTTDHRRLFKDDPWAAIVAAISIGFGEFGSKINGGPNTARDIINGAIQADIDDQQADIDAAKLKNEKANNALQRLLDEGEDPKFAKEKLAYLQEAYTLAALQTEQAQAQMKALGVNTMDAVNALTEKHLDRQAGIIDKIGAEWTQDYDRGARGGARVETDEEFDKRVKSRVGLNQDLLGLNTSVETTMGIRQSPEAQKEIDAKVERYGKDINSGEGITLGDLAAAQQEAEDVLVKYAEDGGIPGKGITEMLPSLLASKDGRKVRRVLANVAEYTVRNYSGAVASDEEKAAAAATTSILNDPRSTDEEVAEAFVESRRLLDARLKARGAGYGADVVDAYKSNLRGLGPVSGGRLEKGGVDDAGFIPDD